MRDTSGRVRAEGLNGAGVAAVMRDTGLTHGGFCKHFGSKDELLLESHYQIQSNDRKALRVLPKSKPRLLDLAMSPTEPDSVCNRTMRLGAFLLASDSGECGSILKLS